MVSRDFINRASRQNANSYYTLCLEQELELANLVTQLLDVW
jgi:hypothetical protein